MNCWTLLHMHTRTCMCGALLDLRTPPPPPTTMGSALGTVTLPPLWQWCSQPVLFDLNPIGLTKQGLSSRSVLRNVCIIAIVWLQPLWKKCRTVLHMHSRTCMCGVLCDLRMAPHNNARRIPSLKDTYAHPEVSSGIPVRP